MTTMLRLAPLLLMAVAPTTGASGGSATQISPASVPQRCSSGCNSDYGAVLGKTPTGIEAYSNCTSNCVVWSRAEWEGTYTGIKWQCVEFARRWLAIRRGVVYGDVDFAVDIWDEIDHYERLTDGVRIPVRNIVNGSADAPRVGDLLIYARVFRGTGHVAVVTEVDRATGLIEVGEQNYSNIPWNGDSARRVTMIRHGDRYWLLDPYLIGWKRMEGMPNTLE